MLLHFTRVWIFGLFFLMMKSKKRWNNELRREIQFHLAMYHSFVTSLVTLFVTLLVTHHLPGCLSNCSMRPSIQQYVFQFVMSNCSFSYLHVSPLSNMSLDLWNGTMCPFIHCMSLNSWPIGMWKRSTYMPPSLPPISLSLPFCSSNTSSYSTHQVGTGLPLSHP